jgi:hypothetical protein
VRWRVLEIARAARGNAAPSRDKLKSAYLKSTYGSIFEPSAEIIRKGKAAKPTEFGKLVKLQKARTGSPSIMKSIPNGHMTRIC